VHIDPFLVEQRMNAHETTATWSLGEACVHSFTLDELLELSGDADGVLRRLRDTGLGYGDIMVPGGAFGEERAFRLSCAGVREALEGGLPAVSAFLRTLEA
jgi:hypothetical protein